MSISNNNIFQNSDVELLNLNHFDGRILNKRDPLSIVLLYSNTCPHCVSAKKVFKKIKSNGTKKYAIDCTQDTPLVDKVPYIFGFNPKEFTVPRLYLLKNGKVHKQWDI